MEISCVWHVQKTVSISLTSGETGEINIFSVEDGRLVRIRSFTASVSRYGQLLVSGSFVYTTIDALTKVAAMNMGTINIFMCSNINSGEQVRRLNFPSFDAFTGARLFPSALVTNGQEVLCGFNVLACTNEPCPQ